MNDLIRRQDAIDVADRADCTELAIEDVKKVTDEVIKELKQLPSEQQWIPCSERLPEDSSPVLITHRGGVSYGWYNGRYFERGANTNHRKLQTVIAWMPLPEPWKGESE